VRKRETERARGERKCERERQTERQRARGRARKRERENTRLSTRQRTHTKTRTDTHKRTHTPAHTHTCTYIMIYISLYMYVYMYISTYLFLSMYINVYIYLSMYTYTTRTNEISFAVSPCCAGFCIFHTCVYVYGHIAQESTHNTALDMDCNHLICAYSTMKAPNKFCFMKLTFATTAQDSSNQDLSVADPLSKSCLPHSDSCCQICTFPQLSRFCSDLGNSGIRQIVRN